MITRGDIKVFLPPIGKTISNPKYAVFTKQHNTGGLTVYCFGDPAKMSDEKVRLALRVHDEVTIPKMDAAHVSTGTESPSDWETV